jgi:nitronate monooxygenase
MPIADRFAGRLALPLIAAPMTGVSGVDLVVAACRAGVIGSFPTHNAGSPELLDRWLAHIMAALASDGAREPAPVTPNLVVHRSNARLAEDVDCLTRHGVELVITSVGPPGPVVAPLHAAGCAVFADVASLRHVDRAVEAGVDGLVLLTAGAGGQTGWANPLAFVRATRERFSGTIVLAGGISDGVALYAARVLGADLGYMGTRFIAATESLASDDYRAAVVAAELDDITLETGAAGLPASLLSGAPERPPRRPERSGGFTQQRLLDSGGWSAGHSVSGVRRVSTVEEIVGETCAEYRAARDAATPSSLPSPVASR